MSSAGKCLRTKSHIEWNYRFQPLTKIVVKHNSSEINPNCKHMRSDFKYHKTLSQHLQAPNWVQSQLLHVTNFLVPSGTNSFLLKLMHIYVIDLQYKEYPNSIMAPYKNNAWVTVNNNFLVTGEVICQWFSQVMKPWVKIISKSPHEWPKNCYSW